MAPGSALRTGYPGSFDHRGNRLSEHRVRRNYSPTKRPPRRDLLTCRLPSKITCDSALSRVGPYLDNEFEHVVGRRYVGLEAEMMDAGACGEVDRLDLDTQCTTQVRCHLAEAMADRLFQIAPPSIARITREHRPEAAVAPNLTHHSGRLGVEAPTTAGRPGRTTTYGVWGRSNVRSRNSLAAARKQSARRSLPSATASAAPDAPP
jgi:hypothetical protein